jgi:hypothetical protein
MEVVMTIELNRLPEYCYSHDEATSANIVNECSDCITVSELHLIEVEYDNDRREQSCLDPDFCPTCRGDRGSVDWALATFTLIGMMLLWFFLSLGQKGGAW